MKGLAGPLLMGLSVTALFGEIGEPSDSRSPVTIYTQFKHPPSDLLFGYMKTELDAILSSVGMRLEWRSLKEATGQEVMAEIVVVAFQGSCEGTAAPPLAVDPGALGWTHISDGEVLPFSDVDCDRIRKLIAEPLSLSLPAEREHLLGRAMARVVAHELYHFFTNTTRHSANGIAKAFYSSRELVGDTLRFNDSEVREVRKARQRPLLGGMHHEASPVGGG